MRGRKSQGVKGAWKGQDSLLESREGCPLWTSWGQRSKRTNKLWPLQSLRVWVFAKKTQEATQHHCASLEEEHWFP